MARFYDREKKEVQKYMSKNRRGVLFADFQDCVVSELEELKSQPECFGKIYNILSRRHFRPNDPIKDIEKIAIKLHKWRKDNRRKKIKGKTPVSEIHDIIGVTISCPYPSDVQYIKNRIENRPFDNFSVESCRHLSPDKHDGYSAFHYVLAGKGRYVRMKCELQLKTVMVQGWGVKTHDLIYKPPGDIDGRLRTQMEKLSHTLQLLDDQSELIRDLIEEAWSLDQKRRHIARKILLLGVANISDSHLNELYEFWCIREDELKASDVGSEIVSEMDEKFIQYADSNSLDFIFCRIVCLYAIGRLSRDRNDFALEFIDDWIDSLKRNTKDREVALAFRSNACMSMGEYQECIDTARASLLRYTKRAPKRVPVHPSLNLAYFLSEAFYHRAFDEPTGGGVRDTTETESCGDEALSIITDLEPHIVGQPHEAELMDTVGAVLISCGPTANDVRRGLMLCKEAFEGMKNNDKAELGKAFFDLHERRAFRRLLSLE